MKTYITYSQDGFSPLALIWHEFADVKTPRGLRSVISRRYDRIANTAALNFDPTKKVEIEIANPDGVVLCNFKV